MQVRKPQRKSHQRDVIHQELRKFKTHPTAVELYEAVRKILPKVSLGTVYRNLEQLVSSGVINKLANGNSVRFDAEIDGHEHVRCIVCDSVANVPEVSDNPIDEASSELAGFKVIGCNVEFLGICPECQKNNKPEDFTN